MQRCEQGTGLGRHRTVARRQLDERTLELGQHGGVDAVHLWRVPTQPAPPPRDALWVEPVPTRLGNIIIADNELCGKQKNAHSYDQPREIHIRHHADRIAEHARQN